jgi:hypothetical protein
MAEVCAMVSLSEGFRAFKEGLDKKFLCAYWVAVWGHAWEIWWGAGVIGVICTVLTIYYAPSRWILGWAVAWVFLVAGYYAWRADHVRLQQKIEATRVRTHSYPHRDGGKGTQYYFGIINNSEAATIHGVRVQLMEIIPEIENHDWLPIPLHLKHDNPLSGVFTQSFDLHPREPRNIDLFTTATATGNRVAHFALSVSGVDLRLPITGRCRFRVMINAEDVPVLFVWFAVWMDEGGILRCEMDPVTGSIR